MWGSSGDQVKLVSFRITGISIPKRPVAGTNRAFVYACHAEVPVGGSTPASVGARCESMSGVRFQALAAAMTLVATLWCGAGEVQAQSLRGSTRSLDLQNSQARIHDFTYLSTATQVRRFVDAGYLVQVRPNRDFRLHVVTFPYARPEVELFILRLAAQYRAGCGEQMVVTSLTRPLNFKPRNASDRSVHPTGMALDLRRPSSRCRGWLEPVLLDLESSGLLEATRERSPPHYHIVIFPNQYAAYVSGRAARQELGSASSPDIDLQTVAYRVRRGDSLWTIARSHGTTVDELKIENGLRSNTIFAGQVIEVPVAR